jgi:hypothetical protein
MRIDVVHSIQINILIARTSIQIEGKRDKHSEHKDDSWHSQHLLWTSGWLANTNHVQSISARQPVPARLEPQLDESSAQEPHP